MEIKFLLFYITKGAEWKRIIASAWLDRVCGLFCIRIFYNIYLLTSCKRVFFWNQNPYSKGSVPGVSWKSKKNAANQPQNMKRSAILTKQWYYYYYSSGQYGQVGSFPRPPPPVFEFFSIGKVSASFVQKCAQQFNVCTRFPFEILERNIGGGAGEM